MPSIYVRFLAPYALHCKHFFYGEAVLPKMGKKSAKNGQPGVSSSYKNSLQYPPHIGNNYTRILPIVLCTELHIYCVLNLPRRLQKMFSRPQIKLFEANKKACPSRSSRPARVDGLNPCNATGKACLLEQCPIYYWLAVTGIMAQAIIPPEFKDKKEEVANAA